MIRYRAPWLSKEKTWRLFSLSAAKSEYGSRERLNTPISKSNLPAHCPLFGPGLSVIPPLMIAFAGYPGIILSLGCRAGLLSPLGTPRDKEDGEVGMQDYRFRLGFQVRDYECDMQGIVNNAVYQNYLEHTRHEFLKTIGIDINYFTEKKIYLVAIRAELDYRSSLKGGDRFWVGLNPQRLSRLKFAFLQDIYKEDDNKLILNAKIIATSLNENKRPALIPEIERAFSLVG